MISDLDCIRFYMREFTNKTQIAFDNEEKPKTVGYSRDLNLFELNSSVYIVYTNKPLRGSFLLYISI